MIDFPALAKVAVVFRLMVFPTWACACACCYSGEKLVNFLVEPKKETKWPTNLPKFSTRADAIVVCKELCKHQFLLRSEKEGKGELGVSKILKRRLLCTGSEEVFSQFSLNCIGSCSGISHS
jgi:hypothetical protein